MDSLRLALGDYAPDVEAQVTAWANDRLPQRIWAKDPTVWSPTPRPEITDRLGWLTLPVATAGAIPGLTEFASALRAERYRHAVLLGMGGSCLAAELFQRTFGNGPGSPELTVLDSTHPVAVQAAATAVDLSRSVFLVSSKSGTTVETLSLFRFFWHQLAATGAVPGEHFIAITDPDTPLVDLAGTRGFRSIFTATPDVGGRYSAFTVFGMVPAALIGVDISPLLERAQEMSQASTQRRGPASLLGAALGVLAERGRDKATLLTSPSLAPFADWAEQLVAESTGKEGKGILPVAGEPLAPPRAYGDDRFFIYLALASDHHDTQQIDALERAGHPVARIRLDTKEDLGAEMFRAEFAVALAGAALGINPFDQPDVEMAKHLARRAMSGELEPGTVEEHPTSDPSALRTAFINWQESVVRGDYLAIHAYLAPDVAATAALQEIRAALRDRLQIATTFGYGPRFLHSTGQYHKGGPNTGLFLQLVDEPTTDVPVPETDYTFGGLIAAQALGDYQALRTLGRRVVRVNLGADPAGGIAVLRDALGFGSKR